MSMLQPPEPWHGFLKELNGLLQEPVEFRCLGGFVGAMLYGIARPTADIDCLEIHPSAHTERLLRLGGRDSLLHKKHRVYVQKVAIVTLPESYESRMLELFPAMYGRIRLYGLEAYDLALSKLERNSPIDRQDVAHLAQTVPLKAAALKERYTREMRPYLARPAREDLTLQLWLDEYFS